MEETSVAGDPGPDAGTSTAPNAAPEPVARRQRILFVGEAATLAHVVRPFVLARSLDPSRYEVHFACDPRFNKLLGPLPFPHHPIHTVPSEEVLLKIAQGRLFYNTRTLRKYIAADRKILNEIAPDVVVGDNRLSLSVSARLAGIPYIAIANAYWSPQARRRFPLPDVPWTRFFGVRPVSILYRLYRPLIFALYCLPLNWLRRKHGLSSLGWDLCRIFTDGDYTLYADVPELVPTYNLPAIYSEPEGIAGAGCRSLPRVLAPGVCAAGWRWRPGPSGRGLEEVDTLGPQTCQQLDSHRRAFLLGEVRYPRLMRLPGMLRPTAERHFHSIFYLRHNARRQEHLATLGLDLGNKSVLEVGAGIGDHTQFFLDRGCKVLCTEPRGENLDVIRQRFGSNPNVTVDHLDLDGDLPAEAHQYDVVYCYGVLYHLSRPAEALAWMCDRAVDLLLLETCVSYSGEDEPFLVSERASSPSQAITGTGCRPSRVWVMNRLREKMPHVYVTATQPRHRQFPLDWRANGPIASTGLARAVFVASRAPLNLPTLVEELPMVQRRC